MSRRLYTGDASLSASAERIKHQIGLVLLFFSCRENSKTTEKLKFDSFAAAFAQKHYSRGVA